MLLLSKKSSASPLSLRYHICIWPQGSHTNTHTHMMWQCLMANHYSITKLYKIYACLIEWTMFECTLLEHHEFIYEYICNLSNNNITYILSTQQISHFICIHAHNCIIAVFHILLVFLDHFCSLFSCSFYFRVSFFAPWTSSSKTAAVSFQHLLTYVEILCFARGFEANRALRAIVCKRTRRGQEKSVVVVQTHFIWIRVRVYLSTHSFWSLNKKSWKVNSIRNGTNENMRL